MLALLALISLSTAAFGSENATQVEFDRTEDRAIHFKVPAGVAAQAVVKTDLYELKYLGALRPTEGLPYFLFSAKPCRECLQEAALYLIRPNGSRPHSFVFPGRILDSKTRALLVDSRAFFGRCVSGRKADVLVFFQKEVIDRRKSLQPSVFVAEAGPERLEEKLFERNFPSLKNTLALVKKKSCIEISGRYRVMSRKPLDIRMGNLKDTDEDDDEAVEESAPAASDETDTTPPDGARLVVPQAGSKPARR